MLFGFSRNSHGYLFNSHFYFLSCLLNISTLAIGVLILPNPGKIISFLAIFVHLSLLVELHFRRSFSKENFRTRYIIKILVGMFSIGSTVIIVDKDYIIYLPFLFGIFYSNVNTILKSSTVSIASILMMSSSVIGVLYSNRIDKTEHIAVLTSFMLMMILSSVLFRTNKMELEESEKRSQMMRCVYQMISQLMRHDVRNELQQMQILAMAKYRNDRELFMKTMSDFTDALDRMISADMFSNSQEINIDEILNDLEPALSRCTTHKHLLDPSPIFGNRNFVYSTLKNLIENSIESANRQGIAPTLRILKAGNRVSLIDNCGGFDITRIMDGVSSKSDSPEHGLFLRTITDSAISNLFGFKVELCRLVNGTLSVLVFSTEPGPLTPIMHDLD
jgi:hypothetical protein